MLGEKTKEVIRQMKEQWDKPQEVKTNEDSKLAMLEKIYNERAIVDDPSIPRKVPDKISIVPQMADGVYGEWLRYLDEEPDKVRDKVILFLHGGGFYTGSCLSRREMAANIGVHAKMDTFIINYRLAPENPYPAALDDCVTAFIWLLKQGYAPNNITVVGESAGATLTLNICHYLRDHYLPLPGKIVPFSPPADLYEIYDSRIYNLPNDAMLGRNISKEEIDKLLEEAHSGKTEISFSLYATQKQAESPYVSPIKGSFQGFPQTLIEVGEYELFYDDAVLINKKMLEDNVDVRLHVWDELFHVFALLPVSEAEEVCIEIAEFARN